MEVALSHKLLTLLMTVEMTKSLINKTWSRTYHGLVGRRMLWAPD